MTRLQAQGLLATRQSRREAKRREKIASADAPICPRCAHRAIESLHSTLAALLDAVSGSGSGCGFGDYDDGETEERRKKVAIERIGIKISGGLLVCMALEALEASLRV